MRKATTMLLAVAVILACGASHIGVELACSELWCGQTQRDIGNAVPAGALPRRADLNPRRCNSAVDRSHPNVRSILFV